jgi:predicted alpha/beta hydrolase family esterase
MHPRKIILPGIGGSGEAHWQTRWERADRSFQRFQPGNWDHPELEDWIAALDQAVAAQAEPPLLVAHSLACLLVAHWAARGGPAVRGALLVALPDPDGPAFPAEAASFREPPGAPLPFPALVIASTDDPYGSIGHAQQRAAAWRAGLVVPGALGHINGASGLGDWPLGLMLLEGFAAGTLPRAQ